MNSAVCGAKNNRFVTRSLAVRIVRSNGGWPEIAAEETLREIKSSPILGCFGEASHIPKFEINSFERRC
ncbi:hypothetical protein GCM10007853_21300 [Algimonas ampicilliniresistens]|uniref:Uncharacterized protein n=1 Tax=Algimonas ampicilliniresistens TaxID=1298735 RepID=A0ABQ5V9N5_9PROT|nr:hypothetical protein GCM10007853_21300 [Algimonas ampicilliniresistens]